MNALFDVLVVIGVGSVVGAGLVGLTIFVSRGPVDRFFGALVRIDGRWHWVHEWTTDAGYAAEPLDAGYAAEPLDAVLTRGLIIDGNTELTLGEALFEAGWRSPREGIVWLDLPEGLEKCHDGGCALPAGHEHFHAPLAVLWQEAGYADGPWAR